MSQRHSIVFSFVLLLAASSVIIVDQTYLNQETIRRINAASFPAIPALVDNDNNNNSSTTSRLPTLPFESTTIDSNDHKDNTNETSSDILKSPLVVDEHLEMTIRPNKSTRSDAAVATDNDNHDSRRPSHSLPATTTSIVVNLSGELGNHLSRMARGLALQRWAQQDYGLATDLVFRDSGYSRVGGPMDIQKCFPKLRHLDLRRGNTMEYDQRLLQQQQQWWNDDTVQAALHVTSSRAEDVAKSLSTLRDLLQHHNRNATNQTRIVDAGGFHNGTIDSNNSTINTNITNYSEYTISLPFLTVEGDMVVVDAWADRFYDDFRDVFQFDYEACCKLKPDADESVLHFRNFKREMVRQAESLGFHELDAYRTAHELFGHLQPGDKVAITSRFGDDPSVQPYVDALTNRSLQVRVITGQSGVEDFCFLLHAKKELVGMAESTYTLWAGYLGNATKVRLYSMDTPGRRNSHLFAHRVFIHYNWTHPALQEKVFFELYHHQADEAKNETVSSS